MRVPINRRPRAKYAAVGFRSSAVIFTSNSSSRLRQAGRLNRAGRDSWFGHDLNSFSHGIAEFQKARSRNKDEFKNTFLEKCQKFKKSQKTKCEQLWDAFQKAYVKKDPCKVPMEDYEPLMTLAPIEPLQDKAMFWSKTKDVVHDFTKRTDCFVTVEDSLLGSVLDGLTWCGKEGSSETLTTGCPDWNECPNNTVSSFWKRISTAVSKRKKLLSLSSKMQGCIS
ncbi:unnamed protein product [Menidia menidia]|uniref:ADP-ribosyl cyclase/cyclic ADP-ribose hydrolase n=1 Tax=Menidia menidia TaxID=238744 RepID=A0A8S4ANW1_9TELE|nr:unnamed protein product [Menidia menidia]